MRNGDVDAPLLTDDHLRQVVNMSEAFQKYMEDTHQGMDNPTLAKWKGNRNDFSGQSGPVQSKSQGLKTRVGLRHNAVTHGV
jgi:hypothetical protein